MSDKDYYALCFAGIEPIKTASEMSIPKEINTLIEDKIKCVCTKCSNYYKTGAIFGYHLRDKEVEELKEQINSLKVIADDE